MVDVSKSRDIVGSPDKVCPAVPSLEHNEENDTLKQQNIVQAVPFNIAATMQQSTFNSSTPDALAQMLINECYVHIVNGLPIVWNASKYEAGWNKVERAIMKMFPGIHSSQRKEVINYIQLMLDEEPMADARYIAFENGIYDLEGNTVLTNSPAFLIPNTIPHKLNLDATYPELDTVLDEWACARPDVRANLEEVLGLAMYRGTEFHIIPLLVGDGGNGKSSFMRLAQGMLGEQNYSVLDPAELGKSFNRIALAGNLANFGDDISRSKLSGDAASILRKLASGDKFTAEQKYGALSELKPYCTPMLSCNEFPEAKDDSIGWWRRMYPIPFEADFCSAGINANVNLDKSLSVEAAYERAIVLGLQGLSRIIGQGGLTPLPDRKNLQDEIREQSSSVYAFAKNMLGYGTANMTDIEGCITADVYKMYSRYCRDAGIRYPENQISFTRKLGKLFRMKSKPCREKEKVVRKFAPKR